MARKKRSYKKRYRLYRRRYVFQTGRGLTAFFFEREFVIRTRAGKLTEKEREKRFLRKIKQLEMEYGRKIWKIGEIFE